MIAKFFLFALLPTVFGAAIDNCQTFCLSQYDPVCGSNGKTYPNQCHLGAATCTDNSITLLHKGPCLQTIATPQCPQFCLMMYDPVCGSDGKTYSNKCEFESNHCTDEVQIAHHGPCDIIASK